MIKQYPPVNTIWEHKEDKGYFVRVLSINYVYENVSLQLMDDLVNDGFKKDFVYQVTFKDFYKWFLPKGTEEEEIL